MVQNAAFDIELGRIESSVGGARLREEIRSALTIGAEADVETHAALLRLATSQDGKVHLVTTNCDEAFRRAAGPNPPKFHYAPHLPVPGEDWSSVVHLHGGLDDPEDAGGRNWVFTSSDFGRAYLTEGWAGRFLTELFRRSGAILFVGYSLADPAVRYIVDAFAVERRDPTLHLAQAYILFPEESENGESAAQTWHDRGVEPLVYDGRDNHRLLHEALRNTAGYYRNGRFDRVALVDKYARLNPAVDLKAEEISQTLWAISDATGNASRHFAKLDPRPPIEWLPILAEEGLLTLGANDANAAPVSRVPRDPSGRPIHCVTRALCEWLAQSLAEPAALQWVIGQGCHLHPEFAKMVRDRLADQSAPALPEGLRRVWRFLSMPRTALHSGYCRWDALCNLDGVLKLPWDIAARESLRSWLEPTIRLGPPSRWPALPEGGSEWVGSIVSAELEPAAGDQAWQIAHCLFSQGNAAQIARDLLSELTDCLNRGLSYLEFLQKASCDHDDSHIARPSIDDHEQNRRDDAWPAYIHLVRETWLEVGRSDPRRARVETDRWTHLDYPIFRRFVLWGTEKVGGLSARECVDYLRAQPPSAMWGPDTHRELLQFLRRAGPAMPTDLLEALSDWILAGPPRSLYRSDCSEETFHSIRDDGIRLRLLRLRDGGAALPPRGQEWLAQVAERHPDWPQTITERDEFPCWMGRGEWVGRHDGEFQLRDYLEWPDERICECLTSASPDEDTLARWRGLLAESPARAAAILRLPGVAQDAQGSILDIALHYLSDEKSRTECADLFADLAADLPGDFYQRNAAQLAQFLDVVTADNRPIAETRIWKLWDLLIDPAEECEPSAGRPDSYLQALNSPIGNLTEVLLLRLKALAPQSEVDLPPAFRVRLERLLNGRTVAHRQARMLLARFTAWLDRICPTLIEPTFLERLDWDHSPEARGLWIGFLHGPSCTTELWPTLRPLLLAVFPHSAELGEVEKHLYGFFAWLLIQPKFELDFATARGVLQGAGPLGRAEVASYWARQAESGIDRADQLFRERLKSLLISVWPPELVARDEHTSIQLAHLAVACSEEFENAVRTIEPLLTKVKDFWSVVLKLHKKCEAERSPEAVLSLIAALVGDRIDEPWVAGDLRKLLTQVADAAPALRDDARWRRLNTLLLRYE